MKRYSVCFCITIVVILTSCHSNRSDSRLGGNCRLRTPNPLKGKTNLSIVLDDKENSNSFYQRTSIQNPIINDKASLIGIQLPQTIVYDFETEIGESSYFQIAEEK